MQAATSLVKHGVDLIAILHLELKLLHKSAYLRNNIHNCALEYTCCGRLQESKHHIPGLVSAHC
jgi:hypothetical protein